MTTNEQDTEYSKFITELISTLIMTNSNVNLLEESVEWIKDTIQLDEVYNKDQIIEIASDYDIDEVFDHDDLEKWATDNGFVKND